LKALKEQQKRMWKNERERERERERGRERKENAKKDMEEKRWKVLHFRFIVTTCIILNSS
jgi:hypothetical protein